MNILCFLSPPLLKVQQYKQDPKPSKCLHSIFSAHTGDEVFSHEEYGHLQVQNTVLKYIKDCMALGSVMVSRCQIEKNWSSLKVYQAVELGKLIFLLLQYTNNSKLFCSLTCFCIFHWGKKSIHWYKNRWLSLKQDEHVSVRNLGIKKNHFYLYYVTSTAGCHIFICDLAS